VRRADVSGDTLLRQKRYEEALVMFDRGIRFDHGRPELYCGRGDVLRARDRLSEARAAVQLGLAADPGDVYCMKALARIQAKE
jgi:predicted Zn-dependent protease